MAPHTPIASATLPQLSYVWPFKPPQADRRHCQRGMVEELAHRLDGFARVTAQLGGRVAQNVDSGGRHARRRHVLAKAVVERCTLILSRDGAQLIAIAMNAERDSISIQAVRLVRLPGTSSAGGGPARVDFVDSLARCHKVLCEPATVAPGSLNADSALLAEPLEPALEAVPTALAIRAFPRAGLAPELVERKGNVDAFVTPTVIMLTSLV